MRWAINFPPLRLSIHKPWSLVWGKLFFLQRNHRHQWLGLIVFLKIYDYSHDFFSYKWENKDIFNFLRPASYSWCECTCVSLDSSCSSHKALFQSLLKPVIEFCFVCDGDSLCSSGWLQTCYVGSGGPWTHHLSASASQGLDYRNIPHACL